MQLDGKRFFYVNPLEVNPGVSGDIFGYKHVIPERPGWYACACCPPKLVRMVTSLGRYAWDEDDDVIYSHLQFTHRFRINKGRPDAKPPVPPPFKSYKITLPAPYLLHPAAPVMRHPRCNQDPQVPH